jgi:hypothetical protein
MCGGLGVGLSTFQTAKRHLKYRQIKTVPVRTNSNAIFYIIPKINSTYFARTLVRTITHYKKCVFASSNAFTETLPGNYKTDIYISKFEH